MQNIPPPQKLIKQETASNALQMLAAIVPREIPRMDSEGLQVFADQLLMYAEILRAECDRRFEGGEG